MGGRLLGFEDFEGALVEALRVRESALLLPQTAERPEGPAGFQARCAEIALRLAQCFVQRRLRGAQISAIRTSAAQFDQGIDVRVVMRRPLQRQRLLQDGDRLAVLAQTVVYRAHRRKQGGLGPRLVLQRCL